MSNNSVKKQKEIKLALGHLWDQEELISKKTGYKKSRETVPFTRENILQFGRERCRKNLPWNLWYKYIPRPQYCKMMWIKCILCEHLYRTVLFHSIKNYSNVHQCAHYVIFITYLQASYFMAGDYAVGLKGSVSRVLRRVLLYIIQKLFSRPIIASHKILTFSKGQFTIYIKQAGATLYYDMVLSRQYWKRR